LENDLNIGECQEQPITAPSDQAKVPVVTNPPLTREELPELGPPSDITRQVRVDNDKAVNPGKVQELMEYGGIDFYARRS
jgi:hypothetical protein